ncbi:hypothetical protein [Paraburkholderia bannensis]|uniref:hypothetical protein n=1 Tax=Paraburkholderia bannensis TaxID=765414 RepID=UPI0005A7DF7B|nr:hypothetical protein [Paraburkholderia bannensis]
MKKRNACLVGLAAGATLLAGCVAQYQNPSACEQEMRSRLAQTSQGELSVTHTAVAYRGQRVVIEGQLKRGALPASAAAASAASDSSAASAATAAAAPASAASGATAKQHATFAAGASAASAVVVASAPQAEEPKPTTPIAIIVAKLGLHKTPPPQTAAECVYDHTGALTSFHWLSPAALAKTTPASDAQAN